VPAALRSRPCRSKPTFSCQEAAEPTQQVSSGCSISSQIAAPFSSGYFSDLNRPYVTVLRSHGIASNASGDWGQSFSATRAEKTYSMLRVIPRFGVTVGGVRLPGNFHAVTSADLRGSQVPDGCPAL
jgi:hypothetical protein